MITKQETGSSKNLDTNETDLRIAAAIERLRQSKQVSDEAQFKEGEMLGREWARLKAEALDLERLEKAYDPRNGWGFLADAAYYGFLQIIDPDESLDQRTFWEDITGRHETPTDALVEGFAREHWSYGAT